MSYLSSILNEAENKTANLGLKVNAQMRGENIKK
jgi:hypothetical protein